MDDDVLSRVIGRDLTSLNREPAILRDYKRVYVKKTLYPMLVPAAGETIEGQLVAGFTNQEQARIFHFEDDGYVAEALTVSGYRRGDVTATVFLSGSGMQATSQPWQFAEWRRRHKRLYLQRIWG